MVDSLLSDFGNVYHSFFARCKFDECAEFFDAYNITFKNHSCLEVCYDGSDHLSCLFHAVCIYATDRYASFICDINLNACLFDDCVVTTGIASIFLTKDFTPDYNSGLAHAIFYALTKYPVIEQRHLHGEVVGFGVLLALLVDGQEEEFEKIYQLNREIGLPVSLKEIEITEDEWKESMGHIPKMSDVAHYPYKVTREMLEDAMQKLKERVRKDQSHEE